MKHIVCAVSNHNGIFLFAVYNLKFTNLVDKYTCCISIHTTFADEITIAVNVSEFLSGALCVAAFSFAKNKHSFSI